MNRNDAYIAFNRSTGKERSTHSTPTSGPSALVAAQLKELAEANRQQSLLRSGEATETSSDQSKLLQLAMQQHRQQQQAKEDTQRAMLELLQQRNQQSRLSSSDSARANQDMQGLFNQPSFPPQMAGNNSSQAEYQQMYQLLANQESQGHERLLLAQLQAQQEAGRDNNNGSIQAPLSGGSNDQAFIQRMIDSLRNPERTSQTESTNTPLVERMLARNQELQGRSSVEDTMRLLQMQAGNGVNMFGRVRAGDSTNANNLNLLGGPPQNALPLSQGPALSRNGSTGKGGQGSSSVSDDDIALAMLARGAQNPFGSAVPQDLRLQSSALFRGDPTAAILGGLRPPTVTGTPGSSVGNLFCMGNGNLDDSVSAVKRKAEEDARDQITQKNQKVGKQEQKSTRANDRTMTKSRFPLPQPTSRASSSKSKPKTPIIKLTRHRKIWKRLGDKVPSMQEELFRRRLSQGVWSNNLSLR